MDSEAIEIAALGRPLHPGMLYDIRSDKFLPGVSLWDQEDIKKYMNVEPQPNTYSNVVSSDSITDKTKLMEVSSSLKVSFLCGLVKVAGSASYLTDTTSSLKQSRFTMQYKQMTEYKHLTMTQLGNVTYPEVFAKKTATHVVIAALYGAQAFMVFDHMSSDEKSKQESKVGMESMIKKIPKMDVGGSGKVAMTDEDRQKVENFSCTFHGDVSLEQNPSTFEDAVLVLKELPKLLGPDGCKAVPMRVWLYPLTNLDPEAAQVEKEISGEQVTYLEAVMGQLLEAEMRANDFIKRCQAIKATDITDKLDKFKDTQSTYKETLLQNIRKVLPAIRAGTVEEQKLVDILKFHKESSFTYDKMKQWLEGKDSEIGVLESYIHLLGDIQIVLPGPELDKLLFDPQYKNLDIFAFTSLQHEEPYLTNLQECLDSTEFKEMENISVACDLSFKEEALPWFRNQKISANMRKLKVLKNFEKLENFFISYIPDTTCDGASHFQYEKGKLMKSGPFHMRGGSNKK